MNKYKDIIEKLKDKDVFIEYGMSPKEILEAEKIYNISFPYEMKKLFHFGLPVSEGFYNWRDISSKNIEFIKNVLEAPIKGLELDLKNGELYWCEDWGEQPNSFKEAKIILLKNYNNAPKLIPIYSHRYMPSISKKTNLPVFSVKQSDIIYYGTDLITYLEVEFGFKQYNEILNADFQYVDFWSDLL